MSTIVTRSGKGTALTHVEVDANFTNLNTDKAEASAVILATEKGAASGVCPLDATSKVASTYLPSYVDDVLEYANYAALPATGETGKIYVALDTNKTYRWSGSAYVYITSGAVDSVAGKTGVVTLAKADVGLSNVDNTTDALKPISTATQTALDLKAPLASPTFTGTVNTANLAYTGTLTGGTGVVAIGTNQIYKDASGNVGIGTSSPSRALTIQSVAQVVCVIKSTNAGGTRLRILDINAVESDGFELATTATECSLTVGSGAALKALKFIIANTERMRIDSSGNVTLQANISVGGAAPTTVGTGITFPATNAVSSNANTLDDYEEGTWTPTYVGFTITSGTSEARYTKVGRVITANIWINATSFSSTANATFTLPIAAVSYSAGSAVSSNVVSGIQIKGSTTGTVIGAITTTSNLALTVTYQLAS